MLGVDSGKEAVYAKLKISPPELGERKPGYVHFPVSDQFGPAYFKMLNSERRETRKRNGQTYSVWIKVVERNEALDTFVVSIR
ncbi:hypothetical protein AS156_11170 [Bradyrhizobium macuxiense]|uniref:Terminase large subunit GpA endonuclease domain-containing protein n=2 Tax=Bradyrhizobium macuxiense TaxID=1755647 RepID=A0A109JN86_9BRAD|nr:hypothetical protein AS156_11170 [Bradyrhizobium macuxiense]